jgi:hypothetical protein
LSDILKDLQDEMDHLAGEPGRNPDTYILLSRAYGEIERLRKANSYMGRLNPFYQGGQFTEEEINRGSEWR